MLVRITEWIEGLSGHLRDLGGLRATLLSLSAGGVLYLAGKIVDARGPELASRFGMRGSTLFEFALIGLVLVIALLIAVEWGRWRATERLPEPDEVYESADLVPIEYRTDALGRAINRDLIPRLFPSATNPALSETMPYEEIDKAGQLNRYMAVGVYSKREARFVGYASFWPVKDEIGEALRTGAMNDSSLTADHVIPEPDRMTARYAVIPGIGVVGATKADRVRRALVLQRTLRRMIVRQYLGGADRRITVIATAYSADGRAWCEFFRMPQTGTTCYGDGITVPVCARALGIDDLV